MARTEGRGDRPIEAVMDLMRAVVESGLPTMSFEVGGKVLQPEIIAFAEAIRREALEGAAKALEQHWNNGGFVEDAVFVILELIKRPASP